MTWYSILQVMPTGDHWYVLAHQWIAAELNVANGASAPASVQAAMAQAATLLGDNCTSLPSGQTPLAAFLVDLLDQYNNGIIGPGHCGNGGVTVVLYPNPANGRDPIYAQLPRSSGSMDVSVKVFTTAFRKVYEEDFHRVPGNADLPLKLSDKAGTDLANGLYFVVFQTPQGNWTGKLLILR